ncbi:MAG: hypothetical protein EOO40_01245 [Deltaproteobacteria bacterium]|nr:MAG: hypothetical protein EOO40_01245 [Deltaproteobacteria bacterium]
MQHIVRAVLQADKQAWDAQIFRARAALDRFIAIDTMTPAEQGRSAQPAVRRMCDDMRDLLEGVQQFTHKAAKRLDFIAVCQFTRQLQASENRSSGFLTDAVVLPMDVVDELVAARQTLEAVVPPSHTKHLAMYTALDVQLKELSAIAAATYSDSIADKHLLTFLQVSLDKFFFVSNNLAEAQRLHGRARTLRRALEAQATRTAAAAPQPPTAEPQAPRTEDAAQQPVRSSSPPSACGTTTAAQVRSEGDNGPTSAASPSQAPAAWADLSSPLQARALRLPSSLWHGLLRTFTTAERQLAEACFDHGSFRSRVEAAAYHLAKHGEPQQSLAQYINCARRATQQFVGLRVPSLRDPRVHLYAVDDDQSFCIFTGAGRIVTFRNRRALGR